MMHWEVCHFDKHACSDLPHLIITGAEPEEIRGFWNSHGIHYIIVCLIDETMLNEDVILWDTTTLTVFESDAGLTAARLIL